MKKIISFIISVCSSALAVVAQTHVSARVAYMADSVPVEYATVRLMDADSATVAVSLTDSCGRFSFDLPSTPGWGLDVTAVGCQALRVSLPTDSVMYLRSSNELTELVVRGSKNFVQSTPRGLNITMAGNPVSALGSAFEALRQLPMIDNSGSGISVFGYGAPEIYINKRRVTNLGELTILSATDIVSVDIITNPSAKYGTDVAAVIILHTRKQNAGVHTLASGRAAVSEVWTGGATAALNYHTDGGLTFFGDAAYDFNGYEQTRRYIEEFYSHRTPADVFRTITEDFSRSRSEALVANAGFNFDCKRHSLGVKYTLSRTPRSHYAADNVSTLDMGRDADIITSHSSLTRSNTSHHVNLFGDFILPYELNVRFDADYISTKSASHSGVIEIKTDSLDNTNKVDGTLWAGKLLLTRKVGTVDLEAGAETSYTRSTQDYDASSSDNLDFFKPETDVVRQNLYAGFIGFDWLPAGRWNLYGGLRLENTSTDFRQNGMKIHNLSKTYTHCLPNVGVVYNSAVRLTLYYRSSVTRPSYSMLDNIYVYVSPTLWETGNPALQASLRHSVGLNIGYRKFYFQGTFTVNKNPVEHIYGYDENTGINVNEPENLPEYCSFHAVAVQQLDFSFWHPALQGIFYVQNLHYGLPERKYTQPLYTLSFNNRFDIPGGVYLYLNVFCLGKGNQGVTYSNGTWQTSVTVNKSWRNWTFNLSGTDIFNSFRQRFDTATNTVSYSSNRKGASRSVSLTIRYTLNTAKGKYKGQSARPDEIDRL